MGIAGTRRTNNSRQCDSGGLDRNTCCHRLCFHSQLCSCLNDHRAAGQIISFSMSSGLICVGQVQWLCLQFQFEFTYKLLDHDWPSLWRLKKARAIQISWHLNLNGSRSPDAHLLKVAKLILNVMKFTNWFLECLSFFRHLDYKSTYLMSQCCTQWIGC